MSGRKIVFLDRDGTLIEEPPDEQVDALDKIRLMPGVIQALLRIRDAGFEFVMVSNQDGLGTAKFPQEKFQAAQDLVLQIFSSQGIEFAAIFICPHFPADGCACRKPALGILGDFAAEGALNRSQCFVIGDRDTDLEFARNLGVTGLRVRLAGSVTESWPAIAERIAAHHRQACLRRKTKETDIECAIDLSQEGPAQVSTGLGFFDHMLEQVARHGGFKLSLKSSGDLHVDEHHTVEDCALTFGAALRQALGDKAGIGRYGFLLAMDEAEAQVALDISGRPFFVWDGRFTRERVGELPTELVPHFFRSFAESLGAALHVRVQGENTHHMIEACFKGLGRSLRHAIRVTGTQLPSTKGKL
jgi:imidazoleglycerol-phosphate dehydratase / histidinol-phosphatase